MGLVALWYVESSWTRDQTHVPRIGRQILIHCATREVPPPLFTTKLESKVPSPSKFYVPIITLTLPITFMIAQGPGKMKLC